METPPVENRTRSDIACPLAAVYLTRRRAAGFGAKVELGLSQVTRAIYLSEAVEGSEDGRAPQPKTAVPRSQRDDAEVPPGREPLWMDGRGSRWPSPSPRLP